MIVVKGSLKMSSAPCFPELREAAQQFVDAYHLRIENETIKSAEKKKEPPRIQKSNDNVDPDHYSSTRTV